MLFHLSVQRQKINYNYIFDIPFIQQIYKRDMKNNNNMSKTSLKKHNSYLNMRKKKISIIPESSTF